MYFRVDSFVQVNVFKEIASDTRSSSAERWDVTLRHITMLIRAWLGLFIGVISVTNQAVS
jgi:hypothetical protein